LKISRGPAIRALPHPSIMGSCAMNRRLRIVVSSRTAPDEPGSARPGRPLTRLKVFFGSLIFALISVAILTAGLLLGSLLAAVILIAFLLVSGVLILKATVRRVRQ